MLSVNRYKVMFFINKYYLLRLFKEQYGFTINDYIIWLRITKSKQLLRFSDMTVEQIAYECGINSPNYFARMFKKIEEISPAEYRKLWRTGKKV
ncbi:AraC family transcriptional regulator [Lachnospiraceae bacterium 48-33]